MNFSFRDGHLFLERSKEERDPILKRLSKIEGQVRGLRQMLEDDRYCLDEVQQANAIASGVREVALLIMEQHLSAGLECAVKSQNIPGALEDLMTILRVAMKTK
jgi:DNA-binding FrmR family transcriptional regulator